MTTRNSKTLLTAAWGINYLHGLMMQGTITLAELEQVPADRLADFILNGDVDAINPTPETNLVAFIKSRRPH